MGQIKFTFFPCNFYISGLENNKQIILDTMQKGDKKYGKKI